MIAFAIYAATGAVAGFLAGLLGVGGGLIIVPALVFAFAAQQFPENYIAHIALGTSLASIVFTSIASLRAHHRHAAVRWDIVRGIAAGIVVGTLLGTSLATLLTSTYLKWFFVVFVFYVATQMLFGLQEKLAATVAAGGGLSPATEKLPGAAGVFGVGAIIGAVSALVGIGGGTLSVPFMTWCKLRLHTAIGTSAAIGFPIAVAGTVGYAINGIAADVALPRWSIGFVYLPALAGLVATSMLTAPIGARLAHRLPVNRLKKVFAALLYIIGIRMAWSLI